MAEKVQRSIIISVFGGRDADKALYQEAEKLGRMIAEQNWVLLCGGRSGIMEAVSKGYHHAGGKVIGILPGTDRSDANEYIDIPIATGIGLARNEILACACDAAVAVGGRFGTLSEIGHALQYGKPVFTIGSWDIEGSTKVKTAEQAVDKIKKVLKL